VVLYCVVRCLGRFTHAPRRELTRTREPSQHEDRLLPGSQGGTVMALLRHCGKGAAGLSLRSWCPAGPAALGALVFLAVSVAGITCRVFGNGAPGEPVRQVLLV
jgi:hypothetical protein